MSPFDEGFLEDLSGPGIAYVDKSCLSATKERGGCTAGSLWYLRFTITLSMWLSSPSSSTLWSLIDVSSSIYVGLRRALPERLSCGVLSPSNKSQ